jgi:cytochrome b6-f complex iron-sulfur subunit
VDRRLTAGLVKESRMFRIVRTLFGLIVGWVASGLFALLGRLNQGALAVRPDRRQFLRNAALGAVGSVLALLGAGFGLLLWPNKTGAFGSELPVSADDIPPVDGVPYRSIQGKFFLVHNQDGLLALYTKCPHLGCTVPWVGPPDSPNAFQCPCHGSMYNYEGVRTGGPAPRPMDLMAVTVDPATGNVMVDTGAITTREDYLPEQATPYAAV